MEADQASHDRPWTFLTNHARVLICIADDPGLRVRDIADRVGITQRFAQVILDDLEASGYLTRTRSGRRTTYQLDLSRPFRRPTEAGQPIHTLVALFSDPMRRAPRSGLA